MVENLDYKMVLDLKGIKVVISCYGSGLYLMVYVNVENEGWDIEKDLDFEFIKNFEGVLEGLFNGKGDYFMWEKFIIKFYVDNGFFCLVGECFIFWLCFVIVVRNEVLENEKEVVKIIIEIINVMILEFKDILFIDKMIVN